jgi:hypothetical protein
MTTITQIQPNIPDHIERMVAEVLACVDPDPERRRAHRIAKLESFPAEHQAAVRDVTNRVIQARNDQRSKAA